MRFVPIQYITHTLEGLEPLLAAGLDWVQLRIKDQTAEEIEPIARTFTALCGRYGATSIINDHVQLAKKVQADGVHLGKEDMSVTEARQILGNGFIIGGTANTLADITMLNEAGADYIGLGPHRFTTTKKNLSPVLGLQCYTDILQQCRMLGIETPIVAIGGITVDDLAGLYQSGVRGVAISSAIFRADDPVQMLQLFQSFHTTHSGSRELE